MLRKIAIGVATVVVGFVGVVATRPATFHVERSTTIAAPPEIPFAKVNDFREWRGWSPYEKMDPALSRTYAGAPTGTGASYAWVGPELGEGRMTIEKSEAPARLEIGMEFIKPFAATHTATFTFAPTAAGTKVTWAMDGKHSFVGKALSLFMDMDVMVGGQFEQGLAAMKAAAEHPSSPRTASVGD